MTRAEFGFDEAQKLYQPNDEVRQDIGQVTLDAIVAGHDSGKDTLMRWLLDNYPDLFSRIVGDTNRPPRPGEVDGEAYHFRTEAEMKDDLVNGRFVQVTPKIAGHWYATRPEQYPVEKDALMAIQARTMNVFLNLGFKAVRWFQLLPPDDATWLEWQKPRNYTPEQLADRDREAFDSYTRSILYPKTIFVVNSEIAEAGKEVVDIVKGKQPRNQQKNRSIAVANMEALRKRIAAQ